jgi:hypothetical protein
MNCAVIDTNVLLVANNRHPNVSPECVLECVNRLERIQKNGVVVIDDAWHIVGEYQNKTQPNQPKGVGDIFLKWLLNNISSLQRVHQVSISETAPDTFAEFPDSGLQATFDPPDRKFPAVANAHPDKPPIWQAADCKWLDWWPALQEAGIIVEFLCREDVCHFYQAKFPDKPAPALP